MDMGQRRKRDPLYLGPGTQSGQDDGKDQRGQMERNGPEV